MANKLVTPEEAAKHVLKGWRTLIKELKKEGITDKEIAEILNSISNRMFHGPSPR